MINLEVAILAPIGHPGSPKDIPRPPWGRQMAVRRTPSDPQEPPRNPPETAKDPRVTPVGPPWGQSGAKKEVQMCQKKIYQTGAFDRSILKDKIEAKWP